MIISSEQFNAAYGKLPFPIREFLVGDDLGDITQEIGKEYGLHIDTVGDLEREITNMLLGLLHPEQFVQEMKSMGIPQESIGSIVKELNAKVFMPLRERMQNAPPEPVHVEEEPIPEVVVVTQSAAPAPAAPVPPVPPAPTVAAPPTFVPPAPAYVAPAPAYVAPAPVYTPPPAPTYQPSAPVAPLPPLVTPKPPAAVPPAVPIPQPPVMASMPAPVFVAPAPPAFVPPAPVAPPTPPLPPDPTSPPISISSTDPQLKPEPFASVAQNVHISARTMAQDMQTAQSKSENRDALHAVLKNYGVDPYREPPE
jgi:hypothetical protein